MNQFLTLLQMHLMPESSYFSTFNSMVTQLYYTFKRDSALDTSKNIFVFSLHGDALLVQTYKKSRRKSYLAIHLLSLNLSSKLRFSS